MALLQALKSVQVHLCLELSTSDLVEGLGLRV